MDTLIGSLLLACFTLLLGWQWRVSQRAHLIESLPAPDTSAVVHIRQHPALTHGFGVVSTPNLIFVASGQARLAVESLGIFRFL